MATAAREVAATAASGARHAAWYVRYRVEGGSHARDARHHRPRQPRR